MLPEEDEDSQELLSYHYLGVVLREMTPEQIEKMPPYGLRYVDWCKHIFDQGKYETLLGLFPDFSNPKSWEEYETAQLGCCSTIEPHVETVIKRRI